jgi:hypothetical protein
MEETAELGETPGQILKLVNSFFLFLGTYLN